MALIKCNECGKEISDKSATCIHCGCPMSQKQFCNECGNEIKNDAKICSNCGCPISKTNSKKTAKLEKNKLLTKKRVIIISIIIIALISLIFLILSLTSNKQKLEFYFADSNNAGDIEYRITYIIEDGEIKTLTGYQYAKPNDTEVAESLWAITNKDQDQYNYYDGLTYKATFSEDNEVILNYSIDIDKAPTMFKTVQTLAGVSGITQYSTVDEIIEIYEDNGFTYKK